MMNREDALLEIFERIKADRETLGIKTFKRTPTAPISLSDLPCIFMLEDVDTIVKRSGRGNTGYPAKRVLEVVIELATDKNTDIKALYRDVRRTIFTVRGVVPKVQSSRLADDAFINEARTEGPTGYGLPDVLGMRLVLDLVYTDNGF